MRITIAIALLVFTLTANAQDPMIEWQNTIGGNNDDNLYSIQMTADGGYILGGSSGSGISGDKTEANVGTSPTTDYWVVKLDAGGNIQWQNTIGGNYDDVLTSIQQTSDGGYIAGGYSNSGISGDKTESNVGTDYWVLKLDAAGNIQWQKTIGLVGEQWLRSIVQGADGGYLMGGQITGQYSSVLVKLDSGGNIQWQQNLGVLVYSIQKTSDDGYILGGLIYPSTNGLEDYWVRKINSAGSIEWQKSFGGNSSDWLRSIQQTTDGGYILGGLSTSDIWGDKTEGNQGPAGTHDYWVVKLDSAGNLKWENTIGGNDNDWLYSIQQTSDGGYILGGQSESNISGDKTENSQGWFDYWVIKLDASGNIVWQNTIGGNQYDDLRSIDVTADGGYILGGWSDSNISGDKTENSHGSYYDYWIVKLRPSSNKITGKVYSDFNTNCSPDSSENGFQNFVLRLDPWQNYFTTGDSGKYELWVDTGSYSISLLTEPLYYTVQCPASGNLTVNFGSSGGNVSSNNDLGLQPDFYCPLMQVDVATPVLRRCFQNTYTVQYCNNGTVTATNSYVAVRFDSSLIVNSSSIPWRTPQAGSTYEFDLGDVAPQECGTFTIDVTVSCSSVLGQTHCVSAHIYPDGICRQATAWDSSSVQVQAQCVNGVGGDTVQFRISNIGSGDMQDSLYYYIVEDNVMMRSKKFQLLSGTLTTDFAIANGSTFRLEAQQSIGHPGRSMPTVVVEGCGTNVSGGISTGFVIQYPQDDADPAISIDCQENVGSFDPNDKLNDPKGVGAQHFIKANDDMEYLIRFQNTGTDTAFQVVVRDTLSPFLDIASVELGAVSHPYNFRIYGPRVLEWTFDNILLPDSSTNEQASHGFVKFRVSQDSTNTSGIVIENAADIYFDYNAPVRTNVTFNTIWNTILPITIPVATITATVNPVCNGEYGLAEVSVAGGFEPYMLQWSNGDSSLTTGLLAGNFSVTVTDALGTTSTAQGAIVDPPPIIITLQPVPVSCFGGADGAVSTFVSGGTAPYSYTWSNGVNTPNMSNLNSGSYTLTVTSSNGCTATQTVTVLQPVQISVTPNGTHVSCFGMNDGIAAINVIGGTPPFTYTWSTGETTAVISGLAQGNFTVTITDGSACSASTTVTIIEPPQIIIVASVTDANCLSGNSGAVDISVSGGTTPYSYQWSNASTAQNLFGVAAGNYSVTVTDQNGCAATGGGVVLNPTGVTINITSGDIDCNNNPAATSVLIISGNAPYMVEWGDGSTSSINDTIASHIYSATGSYTIRVTDAQSCNATGTATILQQAQITVSPTVTDVLCFSGTDGAIDISVAGGNPPYFYSWSNGDTSKNLLGISAGAYSATITDIANCTATTSVTVAEPTQLVINVNTTNSISCFAASDGAVKANATGGTPAYSYLWNTGATGESIANLPAGDYSVTVADANACTATFTVTLADGLQINAGVITGPDTVDIDNNATYSVTQVAGYAYSWSASGNILSGQGTNSVVIDWDSIGQDILLLVASQQGCFDAVAKNITLVDETGIGNAAMQKIELYPNPSAGLITLKVSGIHSGIVVRVDDALGQKLLQETFGQNEIMQGVLLDLKGFSGNVFFLNIRNDEMTRVMKIVKY